MKSLSKVLSVVGIMSLMLTSCSAAKSAAQKGYDKFKESEIDYLVNTLKGSKSDVSFDKCSYVYLEKSGTQSIGTLKGAVYYSGKMTLKASNYSYDYYFVYYSETDELQKNATKLIYQTAYDLVDNGSFIGTTGTL